MSKHLMYLMLLGLVAMSSFTRAESTDFDPEEESGDSFEDEGEHDEEFDHEAVLGSHEEAEEFKDLEPEEAKRRLGILLKKIDANSDGNITKDEIVEWIKKSFGKLDLEDSKVHLAEMDENNDQHMTFEEYLKKAYGYSSKELEDLKKDTSSESKGFLETIEQDKMKFSLADVNKDGKLDLTEYAAFRRPSHYLHMSDYEVASYLTHFDKNKDGYIQFKEFAHESNTPEEQKHEQEHFNEFDLNKDGKLNKAEILSWISPGFDKNAKREADHLIEQTDKNKDGVLSIEEILDDHETWVGSHATDYGDHLRKMNKEEL